jgi:peptidoglycan/xylan/chitin deacetylase (PgdA/CDA1 family)
MENGKWSMANRRWWFFLLPFAICHFPCRAWAYVPGKFYPPMHVAPHKRTTEKIIVLSFDDGPGKFTVPILELLKTHNITATFFMEGSQVESYPDIARQVFDAGHEIGNHTYIHFDYHKQKNAAPERLVHELEQTESALKRALHNPDFRTKLVRMPYGYFNHTWLLPTLKEHGYALVHWDFGTDWLLKKSAEEMTQEYLAHAQSGEVFLFHDGGRHREKTLQAVTTVIETLEKQGYRFVPARELFKDDTP